MRAPKAAVVLGAIVATTLVEPLGARAGEPIAQVSLGPEATRTVEAGPGASLVVTYVDGEKTERQTVDLAAVAPGFVPVEVRALVLGGDTLALAVVARPPDETTWATYHWARDRAGDSKARSEWVVSTPLFRSSGRPFRVVELRAREAGIEATFRRGEIDPGEPDAPIVIEEKVYANAHPSDPEVRYDRPGEVLVEGTLRRDPPATVVITIAADGTVRFTTPAGTTVAESLGGDDPLAVRDALSRLAASGVGASLRRNTLEVRVDPASRWRWVQWGVQALAEAWSLRTLRFPREGGDIDLALPEDAPPSPRREEEPPGIDVVLARAGDGDAARTVVHFPGGDLRLPSTGDEPDESRRHAATEPLRTRLTDLQRTRGPAVVVVSTPPPRGAEVPAGDVLMVVRAVQETNPAAVHLGAASPPGGAAGRAKTPVPR